MKRLVILLLAGALATCTGAGGGRAAIDAEVGRAAGQGVHVTVDDGLAAVTRIDAGAIELWAGAPVVTVRLRFDSGAAGAWTVRVRNALPDATMTAALPVDALAGEVPTERAFRFERAGAAEVVLALAPPDAVDPAPFRFALLSDVQEAIATVQDLFARINGDASIRFVLSAGDLTERGTREELDRFQRELRSLRVPFYATLGNHDVATADGLYQERFGRGSYHFGYRGVDVTMLDSASATLDPVVHGELDAWLATARDRVHVVSMHIPPVDPVGERNAAFGSREEASALLARLAGSGVDLTLYGHIHSFYAFDNAGIPAIISGGGGAHPELLDEIGRHFVTVDLGANGVLGTAVVRVD